MFIKQLMLEDVEWSRLAQDIYYCNKHSTESSVPFGKGSILATFWLLVLARLKVLKGIIEDKS
jgi:hypothetical protein